MDTDLLRTGEVARLLGVSRQHVADMCDRGEIRCVWVGSHRRVPRSEISRMKGVLTREQERSLWVHQAMLSALLAHPNMVLDKAISNIQRWRSTHREDGMSVRYLDEWDRILHSGLDTVIETITSRTPEACELRQNTPFAGVLDDETRIQVLRTFNEHWSHEHQAA